LEYLQHSSLVVRTKDSVQDLGVAHLMQQSNGLAQIIRQ
jgi:hypothetical protein